MPSHLISITENSITDMVYVQGVNAYWACTISLAMSKCNIKGYTYVADCQYIIANSIRYMTDMGRFIILGVSRTAH